MKISSSVIKSSGTMPKAWQMPKAPQLQPEPLDGVASSRGHSSQRVLGTVALGCLLLPSVARASVPMSGPGLAIQAAADGMGHWALSGARVGAMLGGAFGAMALMMGNVFGTFRENITDPENIKFALAATVAGIVAGAAIGGIGFHLFG